MTRAQDDAVAAHNARMALEGRVRDVERSLVGAVEQAAERLAALGFSADDAGELMTACVAEFSDWASYFAEEAEHVCGSPIYSEEREDWYVECSCGWEKRSRLYSRASAARNAHLAEVAT